MTRLIATADLHLDAGRWGKVNPATGTNTAWESATGVWHAICQRAVDEHAGGVLFAGDAFLNASPSPEAQERFADGLRQLADAGIPVVIIPGNHEFLGLPASHRHPLARYADIDGVHISHTPEVVDLACGVQVATLPWPRRSQVVSADDLAGLNPGDIDDLIAARLVETLDDLAERCDPGRPAVLLAHATVGEATLGSDRRGSELTVASLFSEPVLPVDVLTEGPWAHVVLGHIHKRQQVGTTASGGAISYVGSPERIDWSEADEVKGASLLVVKDGTVTEEFFATPARVLRTVAVTAGDPADVLAASGDTWDGVLVRLDSPDPTVDVGPWRKAVAAAGGVVVGVRTAAPAADVADTSPVVAEDITPTEGLERWLEREGIDADRAELVRTVARQLLDEVGQ